MGRITRILVGYFAAALVASIIVPAAINLYATYGTAVTYEGSPVSRPPSGPTQWRTIGLTVFLLMATAAVLAAPVAIPAILLAEYQAITAPAYYGFMGFLAGMAPLSLSKVDPFILFFGLLGVVPGLTYWLISGRNAGD
jgi:hypothetical protein